MFDEVVSWAAALLPWRVWLGLFVACILLIGALALWAS